MDNDGLFLLIISLPFVPLCKIVGSLHGALYDYMMVFPCTVHTNWPVEYQGNGEKLASTCVDIKVLVDS